MQAPTYDFPVPIRRGADYPLAIIAKARDLFTQKVSYLDLTGATVTWTIRNSPVDLVGTSAAGGKVTVTFATSRVDWPLKPADTLALTAGPHAYSVRAVLGTGETIPLLDGTLTVKD